MPDVTVRLPGLLARFADGCRDVPVSADTVDGAIDGLLEAHPALEAHLFDGRSRLRPHLKLFHDGAAVEPAEGTAVHLEEGDEVVVLQAVSGG